MSDSNRLWCPECEKDHYRATHTEDPMSCNECESELEPQPPLQVRVRRRIGQGVALIVLGVVFFGPPSWVVSGLLSERPLLTRETTEITTYSGVLPEAVPVLLLWLMLCLFTWGHITGAIPRTIF
jgi:hypothetical protein